MPGQLSPAGVLAAGENASGLSKGSFANRKLRLRVPMQI
jgi:hypothetical protein